MFEFVTHSIGGSAEDLHQDVFVSARPLHGPPQLLHSVDDGRVQHGEDGPLKVPRQLLLQHVHQLLSQRGECDLERGQTQISKHTSESCGLNVTYVVILIKVGLFNLLTLK